MINVGIIGCGGIAVPHADGYLAIPDEAQVTAVSDVVAANAEKIATQVGGASVYSDYRDLLADNNVNAVDICLPHHLHADAIIAAARAGKQILCEKPLCLTMVEAEAISRAVDESGVTLMCAHNQLYSPAVHEARDVLNAGTLGPVYTIKTVDTFRNLGVKQMTAWRSTRATMGGGELIDTGYHPSYLLLYLADDRPVEVTAFVSNHRLNDIEGEDSAQVLVRFASGMIGHIVTSWAYDVPTGAHQFHVTAERGELYRVGNDLHIQPYGGESTVMTWSAVNGYYAEVADFVACLREHRRPLHTEVEGIDVLRIILGAYRAEMEKRIVALS